MIPRDNLIEKMIRFAKKRTYLRYPILVLVTTLLALYHFCRFLYYKRKKIMIGLAGSILIFVFYYANLLVIDAGDGAFYMDSNREEMYNSSLNMEEPVQEVTEREPLVWETNRWDKLEEDLAFGLQTWILEDEQTDSERDFEDEGSGTESAEAAIGRSDLKAQDKMRGTAGAAINAETGIISDTKTGEEFVDNRDIETGEGFVDSRDTESREGFIDNQDIENGQAFIDNQGIESGAGFVNNLTEGFGMGLTEISDIEIGDAIDAMSGMAVREDAVEVFAHTDWRLLLVNRWNPIADYYNFEKTNYNGMIIDARIYNDLAKMLAAGQREGCSFVVCSAFRSVERQKERYVENITRYMKRGYSFEDACTVTGYTLAFPGQSEHHTGLAVDIVAKTYQSLNEGYAATKEAKWLAEHAHEYGFIVRYPRGKSEITGIEYEPWHFRYVGLEAATEMWQKGICLEEYLEQISVIDTGEELSLMDTLDEELNGLLPSEFITGQDADVEIGSNDMQNMPGMEDAGTVESESVGIEEIIES